MIKEKALCMAVCKPNHNGDEKRKVRNSEDIPHFLLGRKWLKLLDDILPN